MSIRLSYFLQAMASLFLGVGVGFAWADFGASHWVGLVIDGFIFAFAAVTFVLAISWRNDIRRAQERAIKTLCEYEEPYESR